MTPPEAQRHGAAPDRDSSRPVAWRAALAALAIFVLGATIVLWPALAGREVVSSAGIFVETGPFPSALRQRAAGSLGILSDQMQQFSPWLRYAADAWSRDGHLPLWKNTTLCGAPLLGNGQSALLYPTHLLAIALGAPVWMHTLEDFVKLVGGAFCAYLLGRHLRLSFVAALACGAVFGFGGYQIVFLQHPQTNVSLLLPLLLLAVDRVALRPTPARVAGLALVAGLQHLGGHPETAFHCQVAAVVLGLVRCISLRHELPRIPAWRRVGALGAGFVLGAGLAAVQILPLLEYLRESDALRQRALPVGHPAELERLMSLGFLFALLAAAWFARQLASLSRPPAWPALGVFLALLTALITGAASGLFPVWLQLLAPDWNGNIARYLGPGNYVEQNLGFAGAALPLAVLGLLAGRPRGVVRVAAVTLALGLLVGLNAPFVSEALQRLPVFRLAANTRLMLLALLASAVLAGLGLDALGRLASEPAMRRRFALAVLAPGLAAYLAVAGGFWSGIPALASPNVPDHRATGDVAVQLLPRSWHARIFPHLGPLAPSEGKLTAPKDGEIFVGTVTTARPVAGLRLVYGRDNDSQICRRLPMSVLSYQEHPDPDRPELRTCLFECVVPKALFPPEQPSVRMWAAFQDGPPGLSDPVVRPDDRGPKLLAFPAQPASRAAWWPLLWVTLVLALALWGLHAQGRALLALRTVLLALLAVSLFGFARAGIPLLPADLVYPISPPLTALQALAPDGRMFNRRLHTLAPEVCTWYGIRDVRGYDAIYPWRVAEVLRAATDAPGEVSKVDSLTLRDDPDLGLLGLMSVRLIGDAADETDAALLVGRYQLDSRRGADPYLIARNPDFLPRARLVSGAAVEADDERALALLRSATFERQSSVVLATGEARAPLPGDAGSARIVGDRPDIVSVSVDPAQAGLLVLSDTFYPGWTARVDGTPREILRANVAFRAVAVKPGDHMVVFRYEPRSVRAGAALSALCLLLAGSMASVPGLRRRASLRRAARASDGGPASRTTRRTG